MKSQETNKWTHADYLKAFEFSHNAHNGQKIPGSGLDYTVHLNLVVIEIISALSVDKGHDEILAVQCALLHDTIEDTVVNYEDLVRTFGNKVARGVSALSKSETLPKHLQISESLERIQKEPMEIWMVKLADRIANMQTPPHFWKQKKITQYWEDAKLIYSALKPSSTFLANRLLERINIYEKIYISQ